MTPQQILRDWKSISPATRILVFNSLSFNLGFYMLLPYLGGHLQQDIGMAMWAVGLVLGLRVFSQQGLFLLGGTLGDRFGYRRMIILGCFVRAFGFYLFGWGESLPVLILAAFLTGFAGALFTPSSQAYVAAECQDLKQRQSVFALQNLFAEAGMLAGPLVGLALLTLDFRWIGVSAGSVFAILWLVQWFSLPVHQQEEPAQKSVARQWLSMFRHKAFMVFVLLGAVYQLMFHQVYLSIPAAARATTNNESIVTWIFTIISVTGVFLQLPISHFVQRYLDQAKGMGIGLCIMGLAYFSLMASTPFMPSIPILTCAVLFSIGSMFVLPLLNAHIPHYSPKQELGAYYGLFSGIGGFAAFLGNLIVGAFLPEHTAPSLLLWLIMGALGIACGIGLYHHVKQQTFNTQLADNGQTF